MMHNLSFFTAVAVIFTGFYVLARGDWRPMTLKFSGVCISTTAASYMLFTAIMLGSKINYWPPTSDESLCMTIEIYYVARNVALILFHIAVGRDAIHFRKRERRGTLCQPNLLKR